METRTRRRIGPTGEIVLFGEAVGFWLEHEEAESARTALEILGESLLSVGYAPIEEVHTFVVPPDRTRREKGYACVKVMAVRL